MHHKVILITGASSGIGAALARCLAPRGPRLALAARRKTALEAVAADCDTPTEVVVADVTRRDDVHRMIEATIARFGHLDVLVNNAGRGLTRPPSRLTDDDMTLMFDVNVRSVLYGMQETLPHFQERGTGHVINVSSMLGRLPYAVSRSAYVGAKHFVNALTALFRTEVQQSHPGIQYSLVSPGVVYTEFGKNALHGGPDSRDLPHGQPAEVVAEVIAGIIESRAPDVYTLAGAQARVAGYYASVGVDP